MRRREDKLLTPASSREDLTRREFFRGAGAAVSGSLLLSWSASAAAMHAAGRATAATPSIPEPRWQLKTDDTQVIVAIANEHPALCELKNPEQAWNWTPSPAEFPLLEHISALIFDHRFKLKWKYRDAEVDKSEGTKLTLRFTVTPEPPLVEPTSPRFEALELKSIWWAREGPGPIEHWMTVENKTGNEVAYLQQDVVSADMTFTADSTVKLWRFKKTTYVPWDAQDPGVYIHAFERHDTVSTDTDNDVNTKSFIPLHVYDVNSQHGLYIGYEWSFGKFLSQTSDDPYTIRHKAYLWDSGWFVEPDAKILKVPAVFIGTYKGGVDDGTNRMKTWFWNHKIPATLRNNADEPWVEMHLEAPNEAGWNAYLDKKPLNQWGLELVKMDTGWGPGDSWEPFREKWPHGMTAGDKAHEKGLKFSFYMPNRYKGADLRTQAGRDKEKAALLDRYDNWHYDVYRSDGWVESFDNGMEDYLMHEGFTEVLDDLIAKRPGFRYEHCSAAGTLKDYDSLQRITFMTLEDSESAENARKSFYEGSYCIPPVQLKMDINVRRYPLDSDAASNYLFRTGMLGAMMVCTNIYPPNTYLGSSNEMSPSQELAAQRCWALYKAKQRPILRRGNAYHILPRPDGVNWDGIQYFNPWLDKGSVLLFKPKASAPDSKTIKLKGLDRKATYSLVFQDRTSQNATNSGAELMDSGITVTDMTGDYASEIIWMNLS